MPVAGATAGATLMPMVMKAQMTAAKADAIWLRAFEFMYISFLIAPCLCDERSDRGNGGSNAHADGDKGADYSCENRCDLVA